MLRKLIILFFLTFIFSFVYLGQFPKEAKAQQVTNCSVVAHSNDRRTPSGGSLPADSSDKWIVLNIDTNKELFGNYNILINKTSGDKGFFDNTFVQLDPGRKFEFRPGVRFNDTELWNTETGMIIFSMSASGDLSGNQQDQAFKPGNYDVKIVPAGAETNASSVCPDMSFEIKNPPNDDGGTDTTGGNYCRIILDRNNGYKNSDKVKFKTEFLIKDSTTDPENTNHKHRVKLRYSWGGGDNTLEYSTKELMDGVELPKNSSGLTTGGYFIEVFQHAHSIIFQDEGKFCTSAKFEVNPDGGGLCEGSEAEEHCGFKSKKALSQPCRGGDKNIEVVPGEGANNDIDHGCTKVKTALGYVGTSASGFIRWVLGFVLGIGGGIVILIIIIGGYRIMTSQGDPEKVKNAREQITAAILGLLFIIFSLVILQFITDDILQLPGFGR